MYSKEFYSELEKAKREYYNCKLLSESIHPIDLMTNKEEVLEEAGINMNSVKKAAMKIITAGINALKKFIKLTSELEKRNNSIIKGYKNMDINLIDFSKLDECSIPDFNMAYNNIKSFTPPMFDKNDADALLNNNGIGYKIGPNSKFPKGLFLDNGNINKAYFNGLVNNTEDGLIRVDGKTSTSNLSGYFKTCVTILSDRQNMSKRVDNLFRQSLKVSEQIIGSTINTTVTESVLLDSSIFKDEYYDILFEDAITTTQTIQKEMDPKNGINTNTTENKIANENEKISNAVLKYSEIINSIFAEMMNSLDKLYNEAGKFCAKVSQLSNKKND